MTNYAYKSDPSDNFKQIHLKDQQGTPPIMREAVWLSCTNIVRKGFLGDALVFQWNWPILLIDLELIIGLLLRICTKYVTKEIMLVERKRKRNVGRKITKSGTASLQYSRVLRALRNLQLNLASTILIALLQVFNSEMIE